MGNRMSEPFYQKNWTLRVSQMGDVAENVCDRVYQGRTHALGLNRVWQNGVGLTLSQMTTPMRYTPDRITIDSFVECMGVGRDRKLKVKREKLQALVEWDKIGPTRLGVYDQTENVWYETGIHHWVASCTKYGTVKMFPEGKEYYELQVRDFPCDPVEVPDAE